MLDFLGSDGIRTHNLPMTGGVDQITSKTLQFAKSEMLPLDQGEFFFEEA